MATDPTMNVSPSSACFDENKLSELVEGRLDPAALELAEAHLDGCLACRDLLAALATRDVLSRSRSTSEPVAPISQLAEVDPETYEVRTELARGGMGRVLEAFDRRHGRRVAIKVLLQHSAAAAARFQREVEITAALQHPNIVTLYEAGRWADGEPYFAMRLVEGRPLAEVIAATPKPADRLVLVQNLIAVTEALAYAHERGVVHRDLKPSNVLVGNYGETVVIDWGLATRLDQPDLAPPTAALASPSPGGVTVEGHALGTPGFMSPEQARGERSDRRSDVYAIGSMLYHVLTGAAPYAGSRADQMVQDVIAGPPRPLLDAAPDAPPDLVAIATKAMQRDPAQRYPNAQSMAVDLRAFAAGRLVSAKSYSLGALLRRWVARNRALVTMALVLTVAVAVVAGVSARRVVFERDRADALKAIAVDERRAAEELVDYLVGELRTKLTAIGRLDAMAGLGGEVNRYYQRVAASEAAFDAAVVGRQIKALQTLAVVEEQKQNLDQSLALYGTAMALARKRLEHAPNDHDARVDLTEGLISTGRIEWVRGALDAAVQHLEAAVNEARALVASAPTLADSHSLLAKAEGSLGTVLGHRGDGERAYAATRASRDAAQHAVDLEADNPRSLHILGRALFDLGFAEAQRRRLDEAAALYVASAEVRQRALRRPDARALELQDALTWTYLMLATVEGDRGHLAAALEATAKAVEATQALADADRDNLDHQRTQLAASYLRTEALMKADRPSDALAASASALTLAEQLVRHDPTSVTPKDDLWRVWCIRAQAHRQLGHAALAASEVVKALELAEALAAKEPGGRSAGQLADTLTEQATIALALGDPRSARRRSERALDVATKAARDYPTSQDVAQPLEDARLLAALLERQRGQLGKARELTDAALESLRGELQATPKKRKTLERVATALQLDATLPPTAGWPGRCPLLRAFEAALRDLEAPFTLKYERASHERCQPDGRGP